MIEVVSYYTEQVVQRLEWTEGGVQRTYESACVALTLTVPRLVYWRGRLRFGAPAESRTFILIMQ